MDFLESRDTWACAVDHVVYTGAIDEYFDYVDGLLEYRSLRFEHEWFDQPDHQGTACINYTDASVPWTRTVEHKHFDMNVARPRTIVTREFPEGVEPGP